MNGVSESAGINRLGNENKRVFQRTIGYKPYAGSGDAPSVASSFATSFAEAMAVKKATVGQVRKWRRRRAIE